MIEIDVWVELFFTEVFGNGKSSNKQICWVSAFPADCASDNVNSDSNAFSTTAGVLNYLMRTDTINLSICNVQSE
jgi:hypothetical protein